MTSWVRLWHDMPTDPKWRVIAKRSGQRVGDVIAVYVFLLVNASCNTVTRGVTHGVVTEDIAAALDISDKDVTAILSAMQGKVLSKDTLTGWEKRQPKREDNSSVRVTRFRQKNVTRRNGRVTHRNAPDSESDAEGKESIPLAKANGRGAGELPLGEMPRPLAAGPSKPAKPDDPWKEVYDYGKALLGHSSGGIITNLRKTFDDKPRKVLEKLKDAAEQRDPGPWINAFLWKFGPPGLDGIGPMDTST